MRWSLLLGMLIAGCGRIGFDSPPDATGGPELPSLFIGPGGDDQAAGTRSAPWRTFPFALGQLHAGDRLTVLDGDYDLRLVGSLIADCSAASTLCAGHACEAGTPAAPITVRADHPREAHLFGRTTGAVVVDCASWTFDGLHVEGLDDPSDRNGPLVYVGRSTDVALQRMLIHSPNRYANNHAIEIGASTRVLVEDAEIYDYFRAAVSVYLSHETTVRRLYANGRGTPDIAGGYASVCPGGDDGVSSYYAATTLVEDSITENGCSSAFSVIAGDKMMGEAGWGDGHRILSSIALGSSLGAAFAINSACTASAPCNSGDRIASDNTLTNVVSIGSNIGIDLIGVNNRVSHATVFGHGQGSTGIAMRVVPLSGGLQQVASAHASTSLVINAESGFASSNQSDWSVADSDAFATTTPYAPIDTHLSNVYTLDPGLHGCEAYLPPDSPMRTLAGGQAIGAELVTQTRDGLPTDVPFWDPVTGGFPCGAIVPGVNDDPTTSCRGVHERLNVGRNGCALP